MITKKKINQVINDFKNSFQCQKINIEGIEYILIDKSANKNIFGDKTKFEALVNHIHILNSDICFCREYLKSKIDELGLYVLNKLVAQFPQHKFIVYIELDNKNEVIFRFHQQWEEEPYYYDIKDLNFKNTTIKYFKN